MSRYDKRKERDLIEDLKRRGFTILAHYGDRELGKGDVLADFKGKCIRFDNKSTIKPSRVSVMVDKTWIDKLQSECEKCFDDVGYSYAVISITTKGRSTKFCITRSFFNDSNVSTFIEYDINTRYQSIPTHILDNSPVVKLGDMYICKLTVLVEALSGEINPLLL
jgi:Holliday junction resolvase